MSAQLTGWINSMIKSYLDIEQITLVLEFFQGVLGILYKF